MLSIWISLKISCLVKSLMWLELTFSCEKVENIAGKGKYMYINSVLSFSHNVLYPIGENMHIFSHTEFVS